MNKQIKLAFSIEYEENLTQQIVDNTIPNNLTVLIKDKHGIMQTGIIQIDTSHRRIQDKKTANFVCEGTILDSLKPLDAEHVERVLEITAIDLITPTGVVAATPVKVTYFGFTVCPKRIDSRLLLVQPDKNLSSYDYSRKTKRFLIGATIENYGIKLSYTARKKVYKKTKIFQNTSTEYGVKNQPRTLYQFSSYQYKTELVMEKLDVTEELDAFVFEDDRIPKSDIGRLINNHVILTENNPKKAAMILLPGKETEQHKLIVQRQAIDWEIKNLKNIIAADAAE